jgi:hypothetical protein
LGVDDGSVCSTHSQFEYFTFSDHEPGLKTLLRYVALYELEQLGISALKAPVIALEFLHIRATENSIDSSPFINFTGRIRSKVICLTGSGPWRKGSTVDQHHKGRLAGGRIFGFIEEFDERLGRLTVQHPQA